MGYSEMLFDRAFELNRENKIIMSFIIQTEPIFSAEERTQESVSVKSSSSSKTVSGGTFLRNKTKVTGVQDAISRMKAEGSFILLNC